jgi:VanZ family protein
VSSRTAQHGALSRGVLAVTVLVSLAVLFAPSSDVPSAPPGVDKVVHLSLFLALALTARWAGAGRQGTAVLLVVYAAVSEVLQGTDLIGRDAELLDFVADSTGVLLGLLLWQGLHRSSRA